MTTINYGTYDFNNYNDIFQILDYKKLLPLSQNINFKMLFNSYDPTIKSPIDLINILNNKDPSVLRNICSFLNDIPFKIQSKQSSSITWNCPEELQLLMEEKII